jgi:hypothetical protein
MRAAKIAIAMVGVAAIIMSTIVANIGERDQDVMFWHWPKGSRSICFGWPFVAYCQKQSVKLNAELVNENYDGDSPLSTQAQTVPSRRWISAHQPITRYYPGRLAVNVVVLLLIVTGSAVMAYRWTANRCSITLSGIFVWMMFISIVLVGHLPRRSQEELFWNGRFTPSISWCDVLNFSAIGVGCTCALFFTMTIVKHLHRRVGSSIVRNVDS